MTKAELEKATGQELIEQRDYCGVDGYYRDYLDDVNEEMLKRFDRVAKAKDIIKYLLSFIQKEGYRTRWDINIKQAEQFLSDIKEGE